MADRNRPDEEYARESFTFRRMTNWQVWAISIAAVVVLLALLVFFTGSEGWLTYGA